MKEEKRKPSMYTDKIPDIFLLQASRVFKDYVERRENGKETLIPYPADILNDLDDNWLYIVSNMGDYAHNCIKETVDKYEDKFVSFVFKAYFYITQESPHDPYILNSKQLNVLNNLGFSVIYNGKIFNGKRDFCFASVLAYGGDVYAEKRYLFHYNFSTPVLVEKSFLSEETKKMIEQYKQYIEENINEFLSIRF